MTPFIFYNELMASYAKRPFRCDLVLAYLLMLISTFCTLEDINETPAMIHPSIILDISLLIETIDMNQKWFCGSNKLPSKDCVASLETLAWTRDRSDL